MQELINAIRLADDEYLTGLTNKGTLKRAYKDMESEEISVEYGEEEIVVSTGGEECKIVFPLAESKCSCPSRSICRHIVTSILWLKNDMQSEETEIVSEKKELDKALKDELSAYPVKLLVKVMKKQFYSAFMKKAEQGILPEIEESTIVSVTFPNEDVQVRLISPLEYASCTCHSKELCQHKAAAILAWQIRHKVIEPRSEESEKIAYADVDVKKVHDTANDALKFLSEILSDGLVRLSEDAAEQAETIAVMCHNARLADSERAVREIGSRLEKYIVHSPEFNAKKLFSLIMETVTVLWKISKTDNEKQISDLLGEFKAEYVLSDTLELIPIASRYFSSEAGYEGNIYYFVNKDVKSKDAFLTYSDVRPTFYDNKRRSAKYTTAPWGLTGNMQDIIKSEIRLEKPKLANGKISSSSETKAILTGKRNINQSVVYQKVYTDFRKMIYEVFRNKSENETDRLVFLCSNECIGSEFDEITQSQRITIEDRYHHRMVLKVRYKNESSDMVDKVSHIGKIMLNNTGIQYVIFGSVYIENGECYVYPIAVFDDIFVSRYTEKGNDEENETDDYTYFQRLFFDVQNLLCDMIQCGINSFDLYSQITDNAVESQKMGLLRLGNMLEELAELLVAKNHTYSNDNTKIIDLLIKIYAYLETGIRKTEINIAVSNLTKEIDESWIY